LKALVIKAYRRDFEFRSIDRLCARVDCRSGTHLAARCAQCGGVRMQLHRSGHQLPCQTTPG